MAKFQARILPYCSRTGDYLYFSPSVLTMAPRGNPDFCLGECIPVIPRKLSLLSAENGHYNVRNAAAAANGSSHTDFMGCGPEVKGWTAAIDNVT